MYSLVKINSSQDSEMVKQCCPFCVLILKGSRPCPLCAYYVLFLPGINEWNISMPIENYRSWEIACKSATTVQVFAIVGDFLSIFLITMDRFVYINFPLRYEVHVTKRRIFVVLGVTFTLATPFAAIKVWLPDRYVFA